jgi:hypothetical protein
LVDDGPNQDTGIIVCKRCPADPAIVEGRWGGSAQADGRTAFHQLASYTGVVVAGQPGAIISQVASSLTLWYLSAHYDAPRVDIRGILGATMAIFHTFSQACSGSVGQRVQGTTSRRWEAAYCASGNAPPSDAVNNSNSWDNVWIALLSGGKDRRDLGGSRIDRYSQSVTAERAEGGCAHNRVVVWATCETCFHVKR